MQCLWLCTIRSAGRETKRCNSLKTTAFHLVVLRPMWWRWSGVGIASIGVLTAERMKQSALKFTVTVRLVHLRGKSESLTIFAAMENGGKTMAKYRKKTVVFDAVQWTGENIQEIKDFAGEYARVYALDVLEKKLTASLEIETPKGLMSARIGDYIIKVVNGEFYPCKPDIFEKTYERVEEE